MYGVIEISDALLPRHFISGIVNTLCRRTRFIRARRVRIINPAVYRHVSITTCSNLRKARGSSISLYAYNIFPHPFPPKRYYISEPHIVCLYTYIRDHVHVTPRTMYRRRASTWRSVSIFTVCLRSSLCICAHLRNYRFPYVRPLRNT